MKNRILSAFAIFCLLTTSGYALTSQQSKGMRFHGMWEWVITSCPTLHRSYGYWYALKEVGEFQNSTQIIENERAPDFMTGWNSMKNKAKKDGVDFVCETAFSTWSAVFIKHDYTTDKP